MTDRLNVGFCGEHQWLSPGEELTFGRGSTVDLHIDDNPRLHRRFGVFRHHEDQWWLDNLGSRLLIHVHDQESRSNAAVAPGTSAPLTFASAVVRFTAGQATYELEIALDLGPVDHRADGDSTPETTSAPTVDGASVPLTPNQRLLLVALAEPTLTSPTSAVVVPPNKAVASRLGWSATTFNRALDRLCAKLAHSGVVGLVGSAGDLASDRRRRLVEHAVEAGLITADDLADLDEPQPRTD
ncbi:MAG: FHA domain-containing protein [Actinomycetota bacterium]